MPIVDRDRIHKVVQCGSWQAFRVSLKGSTTHTKLDLLSLYMAADDACQHTTALGNRGYTAEEGWLSNMGIKPDERIRHHNDTVCGWADRRDQVLNYLTALSRGGQIEPLAREVWFDSTSKNGEHSDIKFHLIVVRR
jgi:hypothetical protein